MDLSRLPEYISNKIFTYNKYYYFDKYELVSKIKTRQIEYDVYNIDMDDIYKSNIHYLGIRKKYLKDGYDLEDTQIFESEYNYIFTKRRYCISRSDHTLFVKNNIFRFMMPMYINPRYITLNQLMKLLNNYTLEDKKNIFYRYMNNGRLYNNMTWEDMLKLLFYCIYKLY
jgi:hypothetical protein